MPSVSQIGTNSSGCITISGYNGLNKVSVFIYSYVAHECGQVGSKNPLLPVINEMLRGL